MSSSYSQISHSALCCAVGWSVVCADMKDWSKLLSSLENSPHDSEVEFVKYVKRELMDSLTELDNDKKTDTILTSMKHRYEYSCHQLCKLCVL